MHCFPIVGRNHLDRVPRTAIKEGPVGSFARTLLAANTKIRIDFDPAEWWMIFVRDPEHACFDWAVVNAGRRACAPGAAVSSNGQYARPLLALRFAVADRHRPMLVYDIKHSVCVAPVLDCCVLNALTLAHGLGFAQRL